MASFTERKLGWLEAVASDPDMQRLALAVAVKLATRYLNSKTGDAWPGIDRLARDLTANPRNVRRAITSLVEGGWLDKRRGGRGRGDSNRYRIKMGGVLAPLTDDERGAQTNEKGGGRDRKRRAHTPPEPVNESERNPGETHRVTRLRYSRPAGSKSTQSKPFPEEWVFGSAEAAIAFRSPAQWDSNRAQMEFQSFRTYHLKKGDRWLDWSAAWASWCRNGFKFNSSGSRRDKIVELVAGISGPESFYGRQKAAHEARLRRQEEE
ncbi:hypothetical protein [Bradyrhizobium sp. RDT46]|uniref:hypothetical protein n=1 Tax=Bradyrhizobium sp. RDT46 TaxID=3341829 RepID=UPI0035C670F4